jgi:enoyl-CoA hydratase/carnithine racemase
MPADSHTLLRLDLPVAYLRLERALVDRDLAQRLCAAAEDLVHEERVALVVIEGSDRSFCAGVEQPDSWRRTFDFVQAIAALACPVIAAIRGDAIAEGLELALACDIRLFSDAARCSMSQLTQGHLPCHGGTQRLSRIVGRTRAFDLLLTGRMVRADEAERIGIASRVFRKARFNASLAAVVAEWTAKGPVALRYAKEAILKGSDLTMTQGIRLEEDLYALLQTTADRAEGVEAFLKKRKPRYRGK